MYCSALSKIITNGFKALHLEYFFTAGADEVKAWTIKVGWFDRRMHCQHSGSNVINLRSEFKLFNENDDGLNYKVLNMKI